MFKVMDGETQRPRSSVIPCDDFSQESEQPDPEWSNKFHLSDRGERGIIRY